MQGVLITVFLVLSFFLSGCSEVLEQPEAQALKTLATSGIEELNAHVQQFIDEHAYVQEAKDFALQSYDSAKVQAEQFLETNHYAQEAKVLANQAYDQATTEVNKLLNQSQEQAKSQYQELKDGIKADLKNRVNEKIDQTFENF